MKALSKGKGAQFFKKPQKKQDLQQILNYAQARTIASQVGIAEQQILQFKWFFDQLSKFKFPSHYQKQLNEKKTHVLYYDKMTNESTQIHPLINVIRTFFYNEYKSNRSAFTFSSKQEKLLPYVEQKMMKNCMSLNSKRRQVEKVNLQKDENGNTVLSKMARLKPDMKSLVSARSYMLKMLVDKVFTCKEIWGKGKRAKAFASIMNEQHKDIDDDQDAIQESPKDLQTYQSIFTQASKFYEQQYGNLIKIPKQILSSQVYKNSTPQNVLRNMFLLNISKNHIEFYWFARLMDCLSIPHNWSIKLSSNVQTYIYEPLKIKFDIHPSYIYIIKQMNTFKDYFNTLSCENKMFYYQDKQMTFYDFFERQYKVDMYGMALKEELKMQATSQTDQNQAQNKLKNMEVNTNDWMIVETVINSGIQPQDYQLIQKFCDFWRSKYFPDEQYIPSVSPFGQVTWSSTVNYSSIDYCPYKEVLIGKLEAQKSKVPSLQKGDFKPHIQKHILFQEDGKIKIVANTQAEIQFVKINAQREEFIEHYLNNYNEQNPTPFIINDYDVNDFFDQVFVCPFDIDSPDLFKVQVQAKDLDEAQQVPVWIEKVRARKFSARIKASILQGQDFGEIFDQVKQYTLEATGKHEPHKMEEIKQKLRNVKNYKQLETFVNNVTNVDARQERKRKTQQMFNQQAKQDDDIFGSQQEDINISQAQVLQSQQEEQEDDQQEESESTQKVQHEQQVSESQNEEEVEQHIQVIQEENIVEEYLEPKERQEYSFLKDFQSKKVYQKLPELQHVDNRKLETLIKGEIKKKTKQQKYSNSYIKSTVSQQLKKNNQLIRNEEQTKNIKKNLIATNLKYSTIPYKNNNLITFKDNKNAEQFLSTKNIEKIQRFNDLQNITEFDILDNSQFIQRFQSEMGDYQANQVIDHIQSLPKNQIVQQPIEQVEQDNPETQVRPVKKQEEIIVFEPLKRTKPDIAQDARLRHINDIDINFQLNTLSTIFLKKSQVNNDSPMKLRIRSKSISNLSKALQSTQNSSLQKSNSMLKSTTKINKQPSGFESMKSLKSHKLFEDKLFPPVSSFNRVCLGHTASNFLASEPIKRKSQLIVLQARKNLLHKGRGLDTYLSKKY